MHLLFYRWQMGGELVGESRIFEGEGGHGRFCWTMKPEREFYMVCIAPEMIFHMQHNKAKCRLHRYNKTPV